MEIALGFLIGLIVSCGIGIVFIRDRFNSFHMKLDNTNQSIAQAIRTRVNIIRDYRSIDELVRTYEALTQGKVTEIKLDACSGGYTLKIYDKGALRISIDTPNKLNKILEEALLQLIE